MVQIPYEYTVSPRLDHPRASTAHPLSPILSATIGSAILKLRHKVNQVALLEANHEASLLHPDLLASSTPASQPPNPDLQACFAAMTLFTSIVNEALPPEDATHPPHSPHPIVFDVDIDAAGRLSEVSPWLRRYAAKITSMIPSRLPRRVIMAFIHKAPTRYLSLVDEMLSLILVTPPPPPSIPGVVVQDPAAVGEVPNSGGEPAGAEAYLNMDHLSLDMGLGMNMNIPAEPSIAHQLALDIFAHWLVLVILLDGVWWIGMTGQYELGRVVGFRRREGWRMRLWGSGDDEDWWPGSMYEVSRQFDKYRTEV
jgi:hypothetical protein